MKKRIISLSLALCLCLTLLPMAALAETPTEPISYIDENGSSKQCTDYTVLDESLGSSNEVPLGGCGEEKTFVVKNNVDLSTSTLILPEYGTPKIILCDGATLTVGAINGSSSGNLTVYAQSGGTGKLIVNNRNDVSDGLAVYGGTVKLKEGSLYGGITVSNGLKRADLLSEGYAYIDYDNEEFIALSELETCSGGLQIKLCTHSAEGGVCEYCGKDSPSAGGDLAWLLPVLGVLEKASFDDVMPSDWFYDAVQYANDYGLMTGTGYRTFSPDAPVTRGMVMTILARYEGIHTDRYSPWYAAGVDWAVANGISDGTNPEAAITREELATMLYRYASLKGYDLSGAALTSFTDASSISSYAAPALQWAVGAGLLTGTASSGMGSLLPRQTATRAQLAAILYRFFG